MKKYKILILSNHGGSGLIEDTILKNAFEKDGHSTTLETVGYDKKLDDMYDVIIRRNTWVLNEADTFDLEIKNKILTERLVSKNKKTVNLIGLDGLGKKYLCEIFQENDDVIPTINTIEKLHLISKSKNMSLKTSSHLEMGSFKEL